jgi:hypothetical protein
MPDKGFPQLTDAQLDTETALAITPRDAHFMQAALLVFWDLLHGQDDRAMETLVKTQVAMLMSDAFSSPERVQRIMIALSLIMDGEQVTPETMARQIKRAHSEGKNMVEEQKKREELENSLAASTVLRPATNNRIN